MKGNYTKFSAEAKADLDFVNFDKASVRFTFCLNSNDLCEVCFMAFLSLLRMCKSAFYNGFAWSVPTGSFKHDFSETTDVFICESKGFYIGEYPIVQRLALVFVKTSDKLVNMACVRQLRRPIPESRGLPVAIQFLFGNT